MDWFLYDKDLRHEKVKQDPKTHKASFCKKLVHWHSNWRLCAAYTNAMLLLLKMYNSMPEKVFI